MTTYEFAANEIGKKIANSNLFRPDIFIRISNSTEN